MIVETGHYALVLALALALVNSVLPIWGAAVGDRRLMAIAPSVALASFGFIAYSYFALTYAHVTSDFSLVNVVENSHSLKPLIYKISGVWGNHEGSMMLWVLVLAIFAAAVALSSSNMPADLRANTLAVQSWISAAFLLFILLTSNPFARIPNPPMEGNDLNPLLQDPGLAIHPPLLYLGYVGLSITYSFAAAALITGRIDAVFARFVRPWTLIAWICLTLGIAMGSYWAYYTLGWGGFWFWDPVENASLMPWLAATALIHCTLVMEQREALKIWTIFLVHSRLFPVADRHLPRALRRPDFGSHLRQRSPARRLHPRHSRAFHRRLARALRRARGRPEAGRPFRADFAGRGARPQQSPADDELRHGFCRHALSARARSADRRENFGRRAVLQSDLRSIVHPAFHSDADRTVAAPGSAATFWPRRSD